LISLASRKKITFGFEGQVGSEIVGESDSNAWLSSVSGAGNDTGTAWIEAVANDLAGPL
jgi:hypothetical protein